MLLFFHLLTFSDDLEPSKQPTTKHKSSLPSIIHHSICFDMHNLSSCQSKRKTPSHSHPRGIETIGVKMWMFYDVIMVMLCLTSLRTISFCGLY